MNTQGVKLTPEFKARWLAALRDGSYRQGRMALRKPVNDHAWSYCCLGVACDLTRPEEWRGDELDGYDEFPPPAVRREWFVRPTDMGDFTFDAITLRIQEELADMNDGRGQAFAQIADWIEANL